MTVENHALLPVSCFQFNQAGWQAVTQTLISETPVTLSVNGIAWLTFACSAEQLEALAAGFLFNEGVIESAAEIASLRLCENGTHLDAWLTRTVEKPAHWERASGCTGGVTHPGAPRRPVPLTAQQQYSPQALLEGMRQLYQVDGLYQESRGLHCSALFDGEGIVLHAADIGRHNTLDKLAGSMLFQSGLPSERVVLTTGRVSSEMLQKCARMGAGVVVSRTAPTHLARFAAVELGVTLVGYARRDHFVLYTHPERVATFDMQLYTANAA